MLSDLAVTPFAEALRLASTERWSGDLQVRSGRLAKTVFFDHGRLVFAASNRKQDRLGESLIALGRITSGEFHKASALMRQPERRQRFGEALVQAGVMDKSELGHSVARQVRRIALSLFPLDDGVVSFEERPCPIPLEYMVSLSLHRLLYQGIKSMRSASLIRKGLGDLERSVTLARVSPFRFSLQRCSSEELDILEGSRKRAKLRRLVETAGGLSGKRLRAAYALLASGILQDPDAPADAAEQPVVQMETGSFLLSTLQRKPEPTANEAIRQELRQELEHSAELSGERWLHVAKSAPREELIRALEDKLDRYHALLETAGQDDGLRRDIELILGRAHALLRLARRAEPAPIARPAKKPATPPEPEPATKAAMAPAPDEEVAEEAAGTKPAAPEATNGAPAGPSQEMTPGLQGGGQLTLLQMEAEARMMVSDYANAVHTYAKIVDLQPEAAAHHVKLAIAMAFWPKTAKQAERQFHEALRLEPNNPDIHFQFGLYYKAMKQRARALQQVRTAVSLNPRHKLAREELEILSPKDSALTHLKKLFK